MKTLILVLSFVSFSAFSVTIDTKKSTISWKASKVTGDSHHGQVFIKSANLKDQKGNLAGSEIVINLKSFTVKDLTGEWAEKFLGHVKSKDFFNVEKYPTAKIEVTSVKNDRASANLTIMDKTQKVSFPLLKFSQKYVGKLRFDRTKFGIIYGSGNFFKNLGDKMINDEVEIDFEIITK